MGSNVRAAVGSAQPAPRRSATPARHFELSEPHAVPLAQQSRDPGHVLLSDRFPAV